MDDAILKANGMFAMQQPVATKDNLDTLVKEKFKKMMLKLLS
ncbi:hypothetical protein Mpsy_0012 [Methanolobus psychrophilus R15]|nr:hypothetical protein Mpsy_0012 [Methanolobus psychrophilus R15]